jgi:hypothetical protein
MDSPVAESIRPLIDPLGGRETGFAPAPIGMARDLDDTPAIFYREIMEFLDTRPTGSTARRA